MVVVVIVVPYLGADQQLVDRCPYHDGGIVDGACEDAVEVTGQLTV